jgi:hypothetical protein
VIFLDGNEEETAMRWIVATVFLVFSAFSVADEHTFILRGVEIRKGMGEEQLRKLFPSDAITPVPKSEEVEDNFEMWIIAGDKQNHGGSISFENGRVVTATRVLGSSSSSNAYELFVLVSDTIKRITKDNGYTCAQVLSYAPQEHFPQSITVIALPDRSIQIKTANRTGRNGGGVIVEESLRQNPVPPDKKISAGLDGSAHCVING